MRAFGPNKIRRYFMCVWFRRINEVSEFVRKPMLSGSNPRNRRGGVCDAILSKAYRKLFTKDLLLWPDKRALPPIVAEQTRQGSHHYLIHLQRRPATTDDLCCGWFGQTFIVFVWHRLALNLIQERRPQSSRDDDEIITLNRIVGWWKLRKQVNESRRRRQELFPYGSEECAFPRPGLMTLQSPHGYV